MNIQPHNPCIRCGTERIIVKTWKEKIGDSVIINKKSICPNPECQEKVDLDNKKERDKNKAFRLKSEQRAMVKKAKRDADRVMMRHAKKSTR